MSEQIAALINPANSHIKHSPIEDFRRTQRAYNRWSGLVAPDKILLSAIALLMLFGAVMVTSASIPKAGDNGWLFFYGFRQSLIMLMGATIGAFVFTLPITWWQRNAYRILLAGIILLIMVLIPGIADEINGSKRWLSIGVANLQVSEFARISIIIYAASFLQRQQNTVHKSIWPMIRLLGVLGIVAILLLLEPDFGSTAVICTTIMGMAFLAGVCVLRFSVCALAVASIGSIVMLAAPYRIKRLASFLNPWDDIYGSDYQLANSLIAIGRGQTTGVGIGQSMEKHHYLPEAHTDFIFSIIAEELGLIGICCLVLLFTIVVWRAFRIANNADRVRMRFASCIAYGIGLWIGIQALINMSVATGLLPTKGLTLPLISYGGSSVIASLILLSILLRIDSESRYLLQQQENHQPSQLAKLTHG